MDSKIGKANLAENMETVLSYERDIKKYETTKMIHSSVENDTQKLQKWYEIVQVILYDFDDKVEVDGDEYTVISQEGLDKIEKLEFE